MVAFWLLAPCERGSLCFRFVLRVRGRVQLLMLAQLAHTATLLLSMCA